MTALNWNSLALVRQSNDNCKHPCLTFRRSTGSVQVMRASLRKLEALCQQWIPASSSGIRFQSTNGVAAPVSVAPNDAVAASQSPPPRVPVASRWASSFAASPASAYLASWASYFNPATQTGVGTATAVDDSFSALNLGDQAATPKEDGSAESKEGRAEREIEGSNSISNDMSSVSMDATSNPDAAADADAKRSMSASRKAAKMSVLPSPASATWSYNEDDWGTMLDGTEWLRHLRLVLVAACRAVHVVQNGGSVLVHCSDGWDRTAQIVSLAQIIMDPFYRTVKVRVSQLRA